MKTAHCGHPFFFPTEQELQWDNLTGGNDPWYQLLIPGSWFAIFGPALYLSTLCAWGWKSGVWDAGRVRLCHSPAGMVRMPEGTWEQRGEHCCAGKIISQSLWLHPWQGFFIEPASWAACGPRLSRASHPSETQQWLQASLSQSVPTHINNPSVPVQPTVFW